MFLTRCTEITSAPFRFYFAKITTPPLNSNFFCEKNDNEEEKKMILSAISTKRERCEEIGEWTRTLSHTRHTDRCRSRGGVQRNSLKEYLFPHSRCKCAPCSGYHKHRVGNIMQAVFMISWTRCARREEQDVSKYILSLKEKSAWKSVPSSRASLTDEEPALTPLPYIPTR